jgi:hypothetical protein
MPRRPLKGGANMALYEKSTLRSEPTRNGFVMKAILRQSAISAASAISPGRRAQMIHTISTDY